MFYLLVIKKRLLPHGNKKPQGVRTCGEWTDVKTDMVIAWIHHLQEARGTKLGLGF